jgi:hypothetical protein
MISTVFLVVTQRSFERARHLEEIYRVYLQGRVGFMLVSWLAHSSTLKIDAIYSPETLGCLRTTRGYNPEDFPLHVY